MSLRYNFSPASGNANGLAAASVITGNALDINDGQRQKVYGLSALVTVLAETSSLTFAGKWQVSNDGSTWVDVANGSQNAAAVVLATGTGGADTAVTKAVPVPEAAYGWRKARFSLVTAGATGATADTYAISYCFRNTF